MRKVIRTIVVIFMTFSLTVLPGCTKDYGSDMERPVEVNRTYAKIDPSPAVIPTFMTLS